MLEEKLTAGVMTYCSFIGVEQDNLVDDIISYVHEYKLDILLGPEWFFMPKKRLYSKEEKDDIIDELADETKDRNTLVIPGSIMWEDEGFFYNTAYIISGGKIIGEQHKWEDGGSRNKAYDRGCKKPKYSDFGGPSIFCWNGYSLGVEICADMGKLFNWLRCSNKPLLDLYFLASDGVLISQHKSDIPIKDQGYGLNSDGDGEAIVLKREGKNFEPVNTIKRLDDISIYELKCCKRKT